MSPSSPNLMLPTCPICAFPRLLNSKQCALGRCCQLGPPQLVLVQDEYLALFSKAEIRCPSFDEDPAEQHTSRRPHVDAIATSAVDVAVNITLDAVWYARVSKSEQTSVDEEGFARIVRYVECISTQTHTSVSRFLLDESEQGLIRDRLTWCSPWSGPLCHPHGSSLYPLCTQSFRLD